MRVLAKSLLAAFNVLLFVFLDCIFLFLFSANQGTQRRKQFISNLVQRNPPLTHYVASKQTIHVYFQSHNIFNQSCDFLKYTCGWFIYLPRSGLKDDFSKSGWRKTISLREQQAPFVMLLCKQTKQQFLEPQNQCELKSQFVLIITIFLNKN